MLFEKVVDTLINEKYNIDIRKSINTIIGDFFMININTNEDMIKIAFNISSNPIYVAKICFTLTKIHNNFEINNNFYIRDSELFTSKEALSKYKEDLENLIKNKIENDKFYDKILNDDNIISYNA